MKIINKTFIFILATVLMIGGFGLSIGKTYALGYIETVPTKSSVLIDIDSGKLIYEKEATKQMPVASIVKLMTILLTFEEVKTGCISLEDSIVVSENASSMGGSQIFLDANCEYKIGELLKSVIVCSANDSSVALAEEIAGSEENFVSKMNEKARCLGLENTNYVNCTGLPAKNQYSCASDVAKILVEVLKYDKYHEYSSIWMENFVHPSGRTTEMTNTNKLSRFYDGCLGGKTGSTNEAGYCLAVGAERNGLRLVAVVLGASTTKDRFKGASDLLNFGFANFENCKIDVQSNVNISYKGERNVDVRLEGNCYVLSEKNKTPEYKIVSYLPSEISNCAVGDELGYIEILVNGEVYSKIMVYANEDIKIPSYLDNLNEILDDFT